MPDIRLLAIEDDLIHAESLRLAIQELQYVLIDVVDNIADFRRMARAAIPDVLLIDVDLGAEIDGIELAREIGETSDAVIIFLTSFKDKGTIKRATEAKPAAYISKPYEAHVLQAAIEIALSRKTQPMVISGSNEGSAAVFVKSDGRFIKLRLRDITHVEVQEKLCFIHTAADTIPVNIRLKDLQTRLPADRFVQIHRSFLISLDHVSEVSASFNTVKVAGRELPVGKNNREEFQSLLRRVL